MQRRWICFRCGRSTTDRYVEEIITGQTGFHTALGMEGYECGGQVEQIARLSSSYQAAFGTGDFRHLSLDGVDDNAMFFFIRNSLRQLSPDLAEAVLGAIREPSSQASADFSPDDPVSLYDARGKTFGDREDPDVGELVEQITPRIESDLDHLLPFQDQFTWLTLFDSDQDFTPIRTLLVCNRRTRELVRDVWLRHEVDNEGATYRLLLRIAWYLHYGMFRRQPDRFDVERALASARSAARADASNETSAFADLNVFLEPMPFWDFREKTYIVWFLIGEN